LYWRTFHNRPFCERPLCARSGRSDKDAIPSLLATTRDTCFVTSGVIAVAGSGKTNTLAHRVAHLIVEGADPRRILLMAFSRRAASEMTKRVERIARAAQYKSAQIPLPASSQCNRQP
jgi:ATP-dependent exoDNAse (exonuclease V) beta subunit